MTKITNRCCGGPALALVAMLAARAQAQDAPPAPIPAAVGTGQATPPPTTPVAAEQQPEIVVTGSSIRGVAPVGSNLVSVGVQALQKTAATTITELVNTVPAITTSGAANQGQNAYSYYAPQIHSLAGSGSNTTLAIIDGLRMPGGGLQYAQTDPNIIPSSALQRVEVLADGASSIYGSDAVAGVVNFITRKTFKGIQFAGRAGFGRDYRSYDANGIWGTTWDTGGVYIAGQFLHQSPLANSKRDFLSRGDYRPVGGTNTNSFTCSPATVRTPGIASNQVYLSPSAASTSSFLAADAPCNTSIYGFAIQGVERATGLVTVTNEFTDRLSFTGKGNYNHLKQHAVGTPGTISNITAFGPGSGRGGQINPFFVAPPGTGATQETVSYLALKQDGDYGNNDYVNDTFYATGVLEYKVSDSWTATLSDAFGRSTSAGLTTNAFCTACAILAVNGTSAAGGTAGSGIPNEQVVASNQPLTTANALDVWTGLSGNRTSSAVLSRLYSNYSRNQHLNKFNQVKLEAQGKLLALPAGNLRMAFGGEYMSLNQNIETTNPSNISNTTSASAYLVTKLRRNVKSAYVEFYVPVIGADMEVPLVKALDLSISGRYDKYSDFGDTKNPKLAANWQVNDWFKIRGNYARSFVAPPLNQIGDPTRGYIRSATGTGASVQIVVPVSLYPEVTQLPGCGTATVTCTIGGTQNPGLDRSLGAGFAGVKPQKGKSWSVGADLTPPFLHGFTANVTYWANTFIGGVASPAQPLIINSAALHNRLTICAATGCTPQQVTDFTNVANGATVGTLPAVSYFLINRDVGNVINLDVQGIDAQAQYQLHTGHAGTFTLAGSVTYFTRFKQNFGDAPFDLLNTSGYNSQFPSIQTKGRFQLGWAFGGLSIDGFMNYTGAYRNYINTSVLPILTDARGNPIGGGDRVRADEIFDLHIQYEIEGDFLHGAQIYLDAKNLFDRDPPFYNGNTTGVSVGTFGYNGFVSSPIGRVVSAGFRVSF